jgi:hypothetical protein
LLIFEEISSYKIIYSGLQTVARNPRILLKRLVGAAGLEPATTCLEGGGCNVAQVPCFLVFSFQWDTRGVLSLVEPC